jgi:DNA-binding IclR family transcriptional regulator
MDTDAKTNPRTQMRIRPASERRSLSRSATRALDVLELFGQVRRRLRAIEIARALKLTPSTANQLLKTMLESSHLTFDANTKSYLPSPRLARFGGWMSGMYGPDERLRTLINDVHAATGETVTLATPSGLFMQIVDLAAAPEDVDAIERGLRVSIFGSIIGAAYLSTLPERDIRKLAVQARLGAPEVADILHAAKRVRSDGVADGASMDGALWSLAAPLLRELPAPMVLGLAGPTPRVRANLATLRDVMRRAAAEL